MTSLVLDCLWNGTTVVVLLKSEISSGLKRKRSLQNHFLIPRTKHLHQPYLRKIHSRNRAWCRYTSYKVSVMLKENIIIETISREAWHVCGWELGRIVINTDPLGIKKWNHWKIPPWKLTHPLKNGWLKNEIYFQHGPFSGDMLIFRGVIGKIWQCTCGWRTSWFCRDWKGELSIVWIDIVSSLLATESLLLPLKSKDRKTPQVKFFFVSSKHLAIFCEVTCSNNKITTKKTTS